MEYLGSEKDSNAEPEYHALFAPVSRFDPEYRDLKYRM